MHSDLQELIKVMELIDGAKYQLFTNETNVLEGVYFQDKRMREAFERFPDVLLFDATYNLNNYRMPFGVMMIIDGNGESQVAALFIMRSENAAILTQLLTKFKEENPKFASTNIIMMDKSMADKNAFAECFPDAEQQICIFHAKNIWKREITTKKTECYS